MTLFGKNRLNENSVEAFFRCNAFSTHCKCVEEHFQCVLKHCECVSTEAKCIAYPFKKHFQNVFNALANTDNAFNKTPAGCLESFMELVLLLLDTMKSLFVNIGTLTRTHATLARTYRFEFAKKHQIHGIFL